MPCVRLRAGVKSERVPASRTLALDAVVFGGGAAGLWTLDALVNAGLEAALVETGSLGGGQTGVSQGIIHGGLKYSLGGGRRAHRSARVVRDMPHLWRECLAGRSAPPLSGTRVRARSCYLWRTSSRISRLTLAGAAFGLRVKPVRLADGEIPEPLVGCPGSVFRLDEPVIDPLSLVADLAGRHRTRLLLCGPGGTHCTRDATGLVTRVEVPDGSSNRILRLRPRLLILCAGAGNAHLRAEIGLAAGASQRRPLHMVLLRGELPELNGHCVASGGTKVTITSDRDSAGRMVWQIGGQLAEGGVELGREQLLCRARAELAEALPGLSLEGRRAEWTSYRADRAEAREPRGRRPSGVSIRREGNVLTTWPTKLALVPVLAHRVSALAVSMCAGLPAAESAGAAESNGVVGPGRGTLAAWPKPEFALPPWEREASWTAVS